MTNIVKTIALVGSLLLATTSCSADKTAEEACKNPTCPPGTSVNLSASSENSCEASIAADRSLTGASASASGGCFSAGGCTYQCVPLTNCCGSETWSADKYECDIPCGCGNGICEQTEACEKKLCDGRQSDGKACEVCKEDCCDDGNGTGSPGTDGGPPGSDGGPPGSDGGPPGADGNDGGTGNPTTACESDDDCDGDNVCHPKDDVCVPPKK